MYLGGRLTEDKNMVLLYVMCDVNNTELKGYANE